MTKERFKITPAIYLVFRKDGRVLLLKRAHTGYMDGKYSLPAGHLDGGESAIAAAIREAKEEVGLKLDAKNLTLLHTMHRRSDQIREPGQERIDLFFVVKQWTGEPYNAEPDKCSELAWYPLDALPPHMIPEVRFALEKIASNEPYSHFNF
ncbi:MAG TPA: NUDIX domain-containing protein [Candidatus Saccharimonadales bacterium]|nr:NUDIX domain-containing protein [Candidatus Saccharimonadales bacterium]